MNKATVLQNRKEIVKSILLKEELPKIRKNYKLYFSVGIFTGIVIGQIAFLFLGL